jgi:hypothetical protein
MGDYKIGDTFIYEDGSEFLAIRDSTPNGSCEGCAGNVSRQMCDVLPSGCAAGRIIWQATNTKATVLAVTLRLEKS